jgi:ATP-dependent Lhr-like helicase
VDALCAALDRLAGWSAPAPAWEGEILPARIKSFAPADLDALLSQGRYLWLRLALPDGGEVGDRPRFRGGSLRQIPVSLIPRGQWRAWRAVAPLPDPGALPLSGAAQSLLTALEAGGALFHEELIAECGLLPSHVDTALTELVGWGLVTADGFAAFRRPRRSTRRGGFGGMRRDTRASALAQAGRWSRLRPLASSADTRVRFPTHALETLETVARTLLRRYGVVFKALLAREGPLPPWRELLYVFWRLEAQGEVLGGRFVAGFSGEQFALPEAVGLLRTLARQAASGAEISLSAADPLNLAGILTPGERIPALPGRRVLYRNGADAIGV